MAKNDIWVTKNGQKMKMCEMTDAHLKNSIIYFRKYQTTSSERWKLLMAEEKKEYRRRGSNRKQMEILDL